MDRRAKGTTLRDNRKSRAIALIGLPPACSRRIRTTVSTTNIPISPPGKPGRCLNHQNEGSLLDADHPANGVPFARRSTPPPFRPAASAHQAPASAGDRCRFFAEGAGNGFRSMRHPPQATPPYLGRLGRYYSLGLRGAVQSPRVPSCVPNHSTRRKASC